MPPKIESKNRRVASGRGSLGINSGFGGSGTGWGEKSKIIFNNFGTLGEVPFVEQTTYVNTRNKMLDPNGYYLIQTGDLTFDMVSRDGKSWITWQWPQ